jgi:FKBP-type peptidyl-prolyl cis-trans isomerase FklB
MNKYSVLLLALIPGLWAAESGAKPAAKEKPAAAAAPVELKDSKAKISYASGVSTIRNFNKNNVPFDLEAMIHGMRDAAAGAKLQMDDKEIMNTMNELQTQLRRAMAANRQDLAQKNRKRGEEFLAEFKKKEGVQSLPNGVMYKVIKAGDGKKPLETDKVEVKYRGTKLDGTEFDATPEDKTATLHMTQTIMGWREALKQMPVGSKWQIVIPQGLAYGDRGVGEAIGPNETLVFEVELVGIK